jgi:hypothetical protein
MVSTYKQVQLTSPRRKLLPVCMLLVIGLERELTIGSVFRVRSVVWLTDIEFPLDPPGIDRGRRPVSWTSIARGGLSG